MQKLIKEYDGRGIEDDCSYTSKEFISFAKKFKNAVKRTFPEYSVENYSVGHYDLSGFLNRNGNYIYFHFSVPRGEYPMHLVEPNGFMDMMYVRTAASAKDYHGGTNNHCPVAKMRETVESLYSREYEKRSYTVA